MMKKKLARKKTPGSVGLLSLILALVLLAGPELLLGGFCFTLSALPVQARTKSKSKSNSKSRSRYRSHTRSKYRHQAHPRHAAHHVNAVRDPVDLADNPAYAGRMRNYALLNRAYTFYDQGANAGFRGNLGEATDKLAEAANLCDQARSLQKDGRASTLETSIFFELGRAAASRDDTDLARDAFARCIHSERHYIEAYLQGSQALLKAGRGALAMQWLQDGLIANPADPRLLEAQKQAQKFLEE